MRLSNGFVIDKEKTFGELKFTAVRDVFMQNEDGTPSTQLKKRIYDLKCSLHGGIIPVSVPPEVPLREFPYNAGVELVNPKLYGRGYAIGDMGHTEYVLVADEIVAVEEK